VPDPGHTIAAIDTSALGVRLEIFAFIWSLLFPSLMQPEGWLVPVTSPAPAYPEHLLRAEYPGKVRVYLSVDSNGAILSVRPVESFHPDFARSVRQATERWRFKPWLPSETQPTRTEVMLLVLFGRQGREAFFPDISVGLENAPCAYLNREVALSRQDYPKALLRDVDLFAYTFEALNSHFVRVKVPTPATRKDLFRQMNDAIPAVVAQCQIYPQRRFAEFLPTDVRSALSWNRANPV